MKKLMIAAAIVCAAAFAQAASMDWGFEYTYDYNGNGNTEDGGRGTATPYYVMLFDNSYTQAMLLQDIADGKDWSSHKIADGTITGTATDMGELTGAVVDTSKLTITTDKETGDKYATAYFVICNAESVAKADHIYFEDALTVLVPGSGADGTFEWSGADNDRDIVGMNGTAGWTEVVPEPTSGLLLLIGVAGLALRRRRA